MKQPAGFRWRLREVMAARGMWKTTDLGPLLAERGVQLSMAQVYRLAAKSPERLSLRTLAALCDIFDCTPNELIAPALDEPPGPPEAVRRPGARPGTAGSTAVDRPRRARVGRES